jgi:hypothetical protein
MQSVEINNRIISATRSYYGLKKQLKSHHLSTQTKIKLYKTLVRPVLMYGCESWSLSKKEENEINIFERNILRKIYGPTNDYGVWRIRYNQELYGLYNEADIIKMVKAARLRTLGLLNRTEELNPCKKLTFSKPIGTRKKGRPPVR